MDQMPLLTTNGGRSRLTTYLEGACRGSAAGRVRARGVVPIVDARVCLALGEVCGTGEGHFERAVETLSVARTVTKGLPSPALPRSHLPAIRRDGDVADVLRHERD